MTAALLEPSGSPPARTRAPTSSGSTSGWRWQGEPIADDDARRGADAGSPRSRSSCPDRPSYFEILTAAAFDWFADVAVDVAVVEVGVGGTWDATNILDAPVAVVTNVSVDHVEYLGRTRGGDRPGEGRDRARRAPRSCWARPTPSCARSSPQRRARRGSSCGTATSGSGPNASPTADGSSTSSRRPARYDDLFLPLHGAHQADNAAIALTAAEELPRRAPARGRSLPTRSPTLQSPGRLEVVGHQPLVLLDGAHNVAGAQALRRRARRGVRGRAAHARRRAAAREGAARDARGARACDVEPASSCARAPPSPRALDPRMWRTPRSTSASPASRSRSSTRSPTRSRAGARRHAAGRAGRRDRVALHGRRGPGGSRPGRLSRLSGSAGAGPGRYRARPMTPTAHSFSASPTPSSAGSSARSSGASKRKGLKLVALELRTLDEATRQAALRASTTASRSSATS